MGIETVILVVAAVASVAGTVTQMQAASEQKKARQRQLDIEAKQREMTRTAQDLRLKREARAKEAMILNSVSRAAGIESSSFTGAQQAVQTNLSRELKFSEQGAVLASEADDVTREQIRIDASRQRNQALFSGISSVAKSVGKINFSPDTPAPGDSPSSIDDQADLF